MNNNNNAVVQRKFTETLQLPSIKGMINNTLGDKNRANNFITSITSAVATNPVLQECSHATIISAALLGESLNLSPSPQMGHYYMVPFNNRKTGGKDAQFQLGYKGYVQLAMRSGQYKKINATPVKEGELVGYNPFEDDVELRPILNHKERTKAKTIGYYAMFELLNGFRKELYWSIEQMEEHALQYSQGYKAKKGYTFWEKNFDEMGNKTMLRQIISKWGIMSAELQEAFTKDMAVLKEDGSYDYVDNDETLGSNQEVVEQVEEVEYVDIDEF